MQTRVLQPGEKYSLTNDGKTVDILFLGVGSAFSVMNHQTNFLVVKGQDHVLVDFGMTGPAALKRVGLAPMDIRTVLPTHSHADHVGGLECIALLGRYVGSRMGRPKPRMVITEDYQRVLWSYSLQGGLEWNESREVGGVPSVLLHFSDFFDVIRPAWKAWQPRETWTVKVGGLRIELFRTQHIPEQAGSWEASFISYGLAIEDRIFVSGDTRFDRDLIDYYAPRSEVMFHDVQFYPGAVHAHLADLRGLPANIREKMLLIHYADN